MGMASGFSPAWVPCFRAVGLNYMRGVGVIRDGPRKYGGFAGAVSTCWTWQLGVPLRIAALFAGQGVRLGFLLGLLKQHQLSMASPGYRSRAVRLRSVTRR
jgi:hypothetical protein